MHGVRLTRTRAKTAPRKISKGKTCGANGRVWIKSEVKAETKAEVETTEVYSYTYETDEEGEGDKGKEDPEEEETPLLSESLDEYYRKRVFVFVHHFAGPTDPLTTAMRNEALRQGIRLKAISVRKGQWDWGPCC